MTAVAAELIVVAAPPGTTVQDAGRFGWLGAGVSPSGPLDRAAHAAANLAVGNGAGDAAIEIPLGSMSVRASDYMTVSIDGETPIQLVAGGVLVVPTLARAVRYLAVGGGVDVPRVLGSRSTLAVAAIGGFRGRPLRTGDPVRVGSSGGRPFPLPPRALPSATDPADPAVLEITPGPHMPRFPDGALEALLAATWFISSRSDRVGVRLEGHVIPRRGDDRAPPVPMVRGAVQITTGGIPIVLGPDHPVTGGYPVLAVVGRASQSILARLRAKRKVRFALAETER